jgi:GNAT superfamily N-acetyltransferase
MRFVLEKISRRVDRKAFGCGVGSLDEYLRRYALQSLEKNIGVTIVAVAEEDRTRILGYYTVSMAQVSVEHLPSSLSRGLPRYPVPAMRIGRLAVDRRAQGQGIGAALLRDALERALSISLEVGVRVVVVDAIDEDAERFYERFGFVPLVDLPRTLVMPLETIARARGW